MIGRCWFLFVVLMEIKFKLDDINIFCWGGYKLFGRFFILGYVSNFYIFLVFFVFYRMFYVV